MVAYLHIERECKGLGLPHAIGTRSTRGEMRAKHQTERQINRENRALVAAGFEATDEENDLWRSKDGLWFGRNAALQRARQAMLASTGRDVFD